MVQVDTSQILIILSIVVFLVLFIIVDKKRTENRIKRQKRIDEAVERIREANKPGHRPPDHFQTFIKDGVITYRKKKDRE